MLLEALQESCGALLDDVARNVRIQHQQAHRASRACGGDSSRCSRKSSGTSTSRAKNEAQSGLTGEISRLSPCLRMRTSFTCSGKRKSCGSRTAWLAPLRNMEARLKTDVDIDLADAGPVAVLPRFDFFGF